jgi:RNA polymerase sigma-70 factor (ECF subfamily)
VLAGNPQAFEEVVRLHETSTYRTCLAITGNAEDAEEAMQDTFFNAYRNLIHFRGESRFVTWLRRIAVNEALKRLRKRKTIDSLDESTEKENDRPPRQVEGWHPNPEQLYSTEEMRRIVEKAIWALPVPYRIVFVLRDVCGHTAAETGQVLDLSIPAVKSRLLRARLMVRESLARRLKKSSTLGSQIRRAAGMIRSLADRFCKPIGL